MAEYTLVCEYCGKAFVSGRKDKRFCKPAHKSAFHREGPQIEVSENVRSVQAYEQAVFAIPDGYELVAKQDLERYRAALDILIDQQLRAATDPQKKSEVLLPSLPTFTPATEKPVAVIAEESPEMVKKRQELSIKNTLAALDDF